MNPLNRFVQQSRHQVAEVQVRITVLNGYTALGIPVMKAVD